MLSGLFSDPVETIRSLLLSLPALILALCCHEAAHGLVAYWCGDPTAKYAGRITLNPIKHLDPVGFLCMMVFHFGWAKPVPVDPRNFRKPRRDDLLVSLAGITANLLLFVLSCIVMYIPVTCFLRAQGYNGYDCSSFYQYAYGIGSFLKTSYGDTAYYLYTMLVYCATINMSLALFNLLPIPPLDGYHVLNDLILKNRDLFAARKAVRIGQAVLLLILVVPQLSDAYSNVMSTIFVTLFKGLGFVAYNLIHIVGLI